MRDRMIPIASKMTSAGLVFLTLATTGGILLAIDVVLDRRWAIITATAVLLWFVFFWYVLPTWIRKTSRNGSDNGDTPEP
jgi:hypothetical protein